MQGDRQLVVARISAETSASAHLAEVFRWLIAAQSKLLRLVADELPALGQDSLLRLGRPRSLHRVRCSVRCGCSRMATPANA